MIVDAKTSRPNPAHSIQVLTYKYAVPRALPEYRGMEFRGHFLYPDSKVQIPVSGPGRQFIDRPGVLVRRLADEHPARKVPSASECRWYNHWGQVTLTPVRRLNRTHLQETIDGILTARLSVFWKPIPPLVIMRRNLLTMALTVSIFQRKYHHGEVGKGGRK